MSEVRANRRASIIQAACAEFCENGYERAKMESIARRVGIGKSTVYEYYPSKAELLTAVVEWVFESSSEKLRTIFEANSDFRTIVSEYLNFMRMLITQAGAGLIVMHGDGNAYKIVQNCAERFRDFILENVTRAVLRAQDRAEIAQNADPHAVASLVVILSSPILSIGDRAWEQIMQRMIDVLFLGLLPR